MLPYRVPGVSAPEDENTFAEGQVVATSAAGMTFTVRDWDDGAHVFGPAPWPKVGSPPAAGARCLVLFLGADVSRPWVIGVWAA